MTQSREMLRYSSSTVSVAIIVIISCSIILPRDAKDVGFSADLIHRDSPQSPLYNPDLSHFERLNFAFQRSMKRGEQIGSTSLIQSFGEYLMKISYGTPAVEYFLVVDTGSEVSWIQCLPCKKCYYSGQGYSPFNPKDSKTFNFVSCDLSRCLQFNNPQNSSCKPTNKPCTYELKYADMSYSRGELAKDTITVGSPPQNVSFPNFLFGCGHDNGGNFPYLSSGVVGFGLQKNSFISQLSSLHGGKFAFCLASFTSTDPGKVFFGDQAVVSGPGVVSTPLTILDAKYHLMLLGITVGTKKLRHFPDQLHLSLSDFKNVHGLRIVIDSMTIPTYLPSHLQSQVDQMLREQIKLKPVPSHDEYTLCYPSSLKDSDVPNITFHFEGADVELTAANTFDSGFPIPRCLVIFPTNSTAILGNWAQTNFLVGYDLVKKIVSFKHTDCTKYCFMRDGRVKVIK